jgi:hypothetical protein
MHILISRLKHKRVGVYEVFGLIESQVSPEDTVNAVIVGWQYVNSIQGGRVSFQLKRTRLATLYNQYMEPLFEILLKRSFS